MTKASDNLFPGIIIRESADDGSDFSNPVADYRRLFIGEDGDLHLKDSAGTVTDFPAGGGGGGGDSVVFKSADEVVNNSSTLQNDDHLVFAVGANKLYHFQGDLWYDSGTTPDLKVAWSLPASATVVWAIQGDNAAGTVLNMGATWDATGTNIFGGGVGSVRHAHIVGLITTAGTAGNAQFQWAQNTANASNSTVRKGSNIRYRELV